MDQGTIQTILEGGIFVALASIAVSTAKIANNTTGGGNGPGTKGGDKDSSKDIKSA